MIAIILPAFSSYQTRYVSLNIVNIVTTKRRLSNVSNLLMRVKRPLPTQTHYNEAIVILYFTSTNLSYSKINLLISSNLEFIVNSINVGTNLINNVIYYRNITTAKDQCSKDYPIIIVSVNNNCYFPFITTVICLLQRALICTPRYNGKIFAINISEKTLSLKTG